MIMPLLQKNRMATRTKHTLKSAKLSQEGIVCRFLDKDLIIENSECLVKVPQVLYHIILCKEVTTMVVQS